MSERAVLNGIQGTVAPVIEFIEVTRKESTGAFKTRMSVGPSVATAVGATAALGERVSGSEKALVKLKGMIDRLDATADKVLNEIDGEANRQSRRE